MSDRLLLGVEAAAEAAGWGNPAALYLVGGTSQEPTFEPWAELDGHPCDMLPTMFDDGLRADGALGMALVAEGRRWRRFDELTDDLQQEMREAAGSDAESVWDATCRTRNAAASSPKVVVEVRSAVLVTKAGWTLTVSRDRGQEPGQPAMISPTRIKLSRVPDFMHQFLNDVRPTD